MLHHSNIVPQQYNKVPTYLEMSRHKQPEPLEKMAIIRLGDWVALQAETAMKPVAAMSQKDMTGAQAKLSNQIDYLRSYLECNIPWMLHDSVVTEAIRALSELLDKTKRSLGFRGSMGKFVNQMNVIVRTSEVLFTKNLTIVSMDVIPKMLRPSFYTKLFMLTGLVHLNLGSLSGGWKTADMERAIISSLKELHFLKYLFINYDCTDNILKCISQNCQLIEKLDVSCSKCITNDSIDILCTLNKLRSVQLYRTFVSLEGFVKLLLYCENLEDIGRCDDIGRVLEYIDVTYSATKQFMLKTFVSRYATENQLQLTVQMCPYIRSMSVFHNTLQSNLMMLVGLRDLRDLKLLSCEFYADQIKHVLQVKGCNLASLHLEHVDQIDLNALMYISQMCPCLESLTLYNCTLIQHTSLYTKKLEIAPFRNLKRLTLVSKCTDEQLLFLVTNCVNVEFIHFGTAVQLTDEIIIKILDINPLIYLREIRILQTDTLTMVSVDRLIQSCLNLEVLVELESWSLLTEMDRDYVRNYIKINNFNVDTAPIRRYDA